MSINESDINNISLTEIKDMYFNIFQKNPRGRYANDKMYLLKKINIYT